MNNNNSNNNSNNDFKKQKLDKLIENIDNNNLDNLNTSKIMNFYEEVQKLKNKKVNDENIDNISEIYNSNTDEKKKLAIIKLDFLNDISLLKNETGKLEKDINLISTQERSLKKKIKEEIYNEKDTKDYTNLFMIISGIHIIVLLLVIIACIFPIINNVIISCVVVFMYVIIVSIIFVKFKKDQYRDPVDYNTFNLKQKEDKVCRINRKN